MLIEYEKYGLKYMVFPEFNSDEIIHAFSTRQGGVSEGALSSLNMSYSRGDSEDNVKENYRRLAEALGLDYSSFIGCRQVHGTDVRIVTSEDVKMKKRFECDGLITNEPGIVLVTIHADCTPVFIYDKGKPAIGMVHSGWKGTLGEIAKKAVMKMQENFSSEIEDIKVLIGPCICGNCFEVREDVKSKFEQDLPWSDEFIKRKDSEHWNIDLKGIIKKSLSDQGVLMKNIVDSNVCTMENRDIFFTHRGEKGKTGTMASLISLKGRVSYENY